MTTKELIKLFLELGAMAGIALILAVAIVFQL